MPLTVVEPAPILGLDRDGLDVELPRLGRTRVGLRGRHQAANVAVADAILDALEAAGIARVGADARRRGYAERDAGRGGWSCSTSTVATCSSTAPTTRPAPPPWPRPSTTCGRSSAAGPLDARHGVDGRQGRRRRDRRPARRRRRSRDARDHRDDRWTCPGRCPPPSWPRAGGGAPGGPAPSRRRGPASPPLDRALGGPRGPIVVAGSLYLVGAVRAHAGRRPAAARPRPTSRPMTRDAARQIRPADRRAGARADDRSVRPTFAWGTRTFVMGILNVTPDSFSGDGLLAADRPPMAARRRAGPQRWSTRAPTCSTSAASRRGPATRRSSEAEELRPGRAGRRRHPGGAARRRRSASTRPSRPSPRPRSTPAPTLVNDVWGVGAGRRAGPARRRARRPARRDAQPRRAGLRRRRRRGRRRPASGRSSGRSRLGVRRGSTHRRPGHRLRQDAPSQNLELLREPRRAAGRSAGRSCSGRRASRRSARCSTCRPTSGSRRRSRRPRSGSPPASTSSASTTCEANVRAARMSDAVVRGDLAATRTRRTTMSDRIVLTNMRFEARHGVHGWEQRARRSRSRSTSSCDADLAARRARRRPGQDRRLRPVYDEVVPADRRVRRRTGCSRRSPRRSPRAAGRLRTVDEVVVRVRKPAVRLGGPLDYAGVEIRAPPRRLTRRRDRSAPRNADRAGPLDRRRPGRRRRRRMATRLEARAAGSRASTLRVSGRGRRRSDGRRSTVSPGANWLRIASSGCSASIVLSSTFGDDVAVLDAGLVGRACRDDRPRSCRHWRRAADTARPGRPGSLLLVGAAARVIVT